MGIDFCGQEDGKWVTTLKAVWNGLLLRLLIFHPLVGEHLRMSITGGHPMMGDWKAVDSWCKVAPSH